MRHAFVLAAIGLLLSGCATGPSSGGWTVLFDGTSLAGWNKLGASNWRLEDGAAVADQGNKSPSYLVSSGSYGDFELKVEYWVTADANSGVFFRCSDPKNVGAANAYEAQIADNRTNGTGTGVLTDLTKILPPLKTAGQWNTMEISARGSQLGVRINGAAVSSAQSDKYARGPIALQHVVGVVKFRRVEIRPL
jgi:hypothetical protein